MRVIIPDITKYRSSLRFKYVLPEKTGNMKYNAAGLRSVAMYEYAVGIDKSEADYVEAVYNHYLAKGIDFMDQGALQMVAQLNFDLNGGLPVYNAEYIKQMHSVLGGSQSTIAREITNITSGSGKFGSDRALSVMSRERMSAMERLVSKGILRKVN